jgi:hypothetical protein
MNRHVQYLIEADVHDTKFIACFLMIIDVMQNWTVNRFFFSDNLSEKVSLKIFFLMKIT